MSEFYFHIGFHKTATSTLQQEFFPQCKDLNLLLAKNLAVRDFTNYVIGKDPAYFDPEEARAFLAPHVSETMPNLLSFESLTGPPFAGVHHGIDYRTPILRKLHAAYPEARIILVIRRQDGYAKSFYRQYVKSGGTASISRFFGETGPRWRTAILSRDRFRYGPYLDELYRLFGENILLLPFELLKEDNTVFLKRITEFVGIQLPDIELTRRNATKLGPFGMEVTRILNRISPFRNQLNESGLIPGIPLLRKQGGIKYYDPISLVHDHWPSFGKPSKEKEARYYRLCTELLEAANEDNRQIDERYGLDLKKYGYYK